MKEGESGRVRESWDRLSERMREGGKEGEKGGREREWERERGGGEIDR